MTPQEMTAVNDALDRLSVEAQREFLELWAMIDPRDDAQRSELVEQVFPRLVGYYGEATAALGADVFEAQAVELGIVPRTEVAPGVNAARASARLNGELNMTTTLATSLALVDELVKQPYRSTVQDSAINSGAGWARVPMGDTCNFCVMLGSRGGVYESKKVAILGFSGKTYHGDCDCQPVLVRSPADYPEGYDPEAMYEKYKAVHAYGDTGKQVVAKMREAYGGH